MVAYYGRLIVGDGSGGGGGDGFIGGGGGGAGGGGADTLTGTAYNDVIFGDGSGGGAGGSAFSANSGGLGGGGVDALYGGAGNDILFGDGFNGQNAGYKQGGAGGFGGGGGGGGYTGYSVASGGLGAGSGGTGAINSTSSAWSIKDGYSYASAPGAGALLSHGGGGGGFGLSGLGGAGDFNYSPFGSAGGTSTYTASDAGGNFYNTALAQVTAGNIYNSTAGTTSGYGSGSDLLDGGAGSDHYFGMGGADTFVVSAQDNVVSETDTIWDFNRGAGDKITLENTSGGQLYTYEVNNLLSAATIGADTTLTASNGSTIVIKGVTDLTAADFNVNVACFMPGTRFATDKGEVAIEDLKVGEMMLTEHGYRPLKWLAHRDVDWSMIIPRRAAPVLVKQGALGDNLPQRDLFISPAHALLVDGLLVTAELLVNGDSIVQLTDFDRDFTYYNIELDEHSVVYAEGMAVESYLEVGSNRAMYDNAAEFHAQHPAHRAPAAMEKARVNLKHQLSPALLNRLAQQARKAA